MNEPKFTPGPWKVIRRKREGQDFTEVSDTDGLWVIAEVPGPNQDVNARLIATAPEMYDALKFLVHVDHDSADYDDAIALAQRALAKAHGEKR